MSRELERASARSRRRPERLGSAGDPVVVVRRGRVAAANRAALRLLGATSAEEAVGRPVAELIHPGDGAAARRLSAARPGGPAVLDEVRVLRPDRSSVSVLAAAVGVDHEGLPATSVTLRVLPAGAAGGVDARALAGREGEGEEVLAAIYDRAPFGIALTRMPEGVIVSVNDAVLEILGFSREEVIGRTSVELGISDPQSRERVVTELRRRGSARGLEVRRRTKSGAERVFSLNLDRVLVRGGEHVLTTIEDVTERRRAEERLRAADRHKDEFLATLSHELRNPLAPVRASLYVLERATPGGAKARKALAVIERQVNQLARLVDDLLDTARVARGTLQIRRERLELGDLVRRTVDDHRAVFAEGDVALHASTTMRPLWIDGDAARLSQAVGNLLGNAAKFTDAGGCVAVELSSTDGEAVLRVRDTGIGLTPEQIGGLFEPFGQTEHGLDRRRGGLGLGLALVKALVQVHGGSVEVSSEGPLLGSTFVLRLPLAAVEEAPPPRSTPPVSELAPSPRCRVLVIEDNVDAAESLVEALELEGHEVAVAHSGAEGIRKARELDPEVVLCDIGLPGMDGYAVARAFRADETLRGTGLVALTGYALREDVTRASEAGFDRHLAKPPSIEALTRMIADVRGARLGAAAPEAARGDAGA